jgi:hypothetical protein
MYKWCYKWKIKSFFPIAGRDIFDPDFIGQQPTDFLREGEGTCSFTVH